MLKVVASNPKPETKQLIIRMVRDSDQLRLLTKAELRTVYCFLEGVRDEISHNLDRVDGKI
jgi:hypothetical protein